MAAGRVAKAAGATLETCLAEARAGKPQPVYLLDGDALSELVAPLDLGWKARAQAETALISDLIPLLSKRAQGREISGLSAYE